MLCILILFAVSFSVGTYMITAECLSLPTFKAAMTVMKASKREKMKGISYEVFVLSLSSKLSKYIKIDEYKKKKLLASLKTAGIKLSPETFIAKAWVKAGLVLLCIIPSIVLFPIISIGVLFLSIMVYFKEIRSAEEFMRKQRESIEHDLPRFVLTLEQELKCSRDILRILETFKKNAGQAFKYELDITTADMKSGGHEAALSRLEARVGSAMLSDVVRGLLSVIRGDDGRVYFQMLAHDFKILEVQKLKLDAMKRPSKVRKYSFFMLGCFILMYLAVMAIEILKTFSNLF